MRKFFRRARTSIYRIRQERMAEEILVGYVGCTHCGAEIPIFTKGLDVQEDADGDLALCAPLETSDLEAHRLMHHANWGNL